MKATKVSDSSFDASMLYRIAHAFVTDCFDGPLMLKLQGFLRSRNISGLCSLSLPDYESNSQDFANLRQLQSFFKKNSSFSEDAACSSAALDSFHASERLCRISNRRLDYYYQHQDRLDPDMLFYIQNVEQFIRTTLGDFRSFLDQIPDLVKMTGGATEDRSRRKSIPFLKISRKLCFPTKAAPLVECFLRFIGNTRPLRTRCVDTNRVEFVPKNFQTHRTIACEPTASIPFQLAFDSYVKRKLRKVGCDLSDQTKNQELARIGSITGEYATLDLKSASDTISYNCVAWLLPTDWFRFVDSLRCTNYRGAVGQGQYSKFSSMGNGCTFALESLIFLACIRAVGCLDGTTYGDDIIISSKFVEPLTRLLRFLGFKLNASKSYVSGPFRESCGADWFEGRNITPFYIRKLPTSRSELCHVINGLARTSLPYGKVWTILKTLSRGLPRVPVSEDTGAGIHVSYAFALKQGLIVNSKALGPHIPASKQLCEISENLDSPGIQSYLLFLIFGKRVSIGFAKRNGKIQVIEPSCFTIWSTGRTRRVLRYAAVRPWSCNFYAMDLWEEFLQNSS